MYGERAHFNCRHAIAMFVFLGMLGGKSNPFPYLHYALSHAAMQVWDFPLFHYHFIVFSFSLGLRFPPIFSCLHVTFTVNCCYVLQFVCNLNRNKNQQILFLVLFSTSWPRRVCFAGFLLK